MPKGLGTSPKEVFELWPEEKKCKEGYHFRMGIWFHRNGWGERAVLLDEKAKESLGRALVHSGGDLEKALELIRIALMRKATNG